MKEKAEPLSQTEKMSISACPIKMLSAHFLRAPTVFDAQGFYSPGTISVLIKVIKEVGEI